MWEVLEMLSPEDRENAAIHLEAGKGITASRSAAIEYAESLWSSGEFDEAIEAVGSLEESGSCGAVGIGWKNPIVSVQKSWYPDVRIGNTRVDADDVALDFDAETGHIFAAVSWSDSWTMNISTDGGESWAETFAYAGGASRIGMTVAGDRVWVSYSPDSYPEEVRMRRFHVLTGYIDDVYWWELVDDVSPRIVVDLTLGSNADDFDNRVFPMVITTGGDLRFYWTNLDGTTFSETSPPISDALDGLDFHWNSHDTSGYVAYLSFVSTGDTVQVWRVDLMGNWDLVMSADFTGGYHDRTAISAHRGNVYVAYQHEYPEGYGIRYRASYNNGSSWATGTIYQPGTGDPPGWEPDLSLRSGLGSAAVYNREDGLVDHAYITTRTGYAPGPWGAPETFNDHDLVSGSHNVIEWLGGSTCEMSHGVVYLAEDFIPFFDIRIRNGIFCDGFESGDTSGWSASVP